MEDPNVISLKMEHVLVVLGFCIGFGMVVCVAIVYFKVKPVRSFKMLNNNSGMQYYYTLERLATSPIQKK